MASCVFVVRLILAATLLLFGATPWAATIAIVALVALLLAFNLRLPWGMEGADDMAVHVALGLAAYAALAYVTAGVTKLAEPTWRSGVALAWVVNLEGFGAAWAAELLGPRPRLRRALSWTVMLAEVGAPLAILLPAPGIVGALAAGLVFHGSLAACMGLNTFVWAFAATYPAVLFVWAALRPLIG